MRAACGALGCRGGIDLAGQRSRCRLESQHTHNDEEASVSARRFNKDVHPSEQFVDKVGVVLVILAFIGVVMLAGRLVFQAVTGQ